MFAPLFEKKAIFRKLPDNWAQKNIMIIECARIAWNHEKKAKSNLDMLITPFLDQIITPETPKLGPDNNFTVYIYIYKCCRVSSLAKLKMKLQNLSLPAEPSKSWVKILAKVPPPPTLICT